jgi:hypothetical protein
MSEELTKDMPDGPSFEERVFTRLVRADQTRIENRVDKIEATPSS